MAQSVGKDSNNTVQLEGHVERLFVNMEKSRKLFEIENYKESQQYSNQSIDILEQLGDLFMPIDERIRWSRDEEQKILIELESKVKKRSKSNDKAFTKNLVKRQSKNKQKTVETVNIIDKYKDEQSNKQHNQTNDPGAKSSQIDESTLIKVNTLLQDAVQAEAKVIKSLNKIDFSGAQSKAKISYEKLDEALQLLSENQDSKNSSDQRDQNSDDNEKNQKDGNKDESNKENQSKESKNSNQSSTPSDEKDQASKQKISSKDALKELAKLMKAQNDEKKQKEKKYGRLNVPSRIPVEKDW